MLAVVSVSMTPCATCEGRVRSRHVVEQVGDALARDDDVLGDLALRKGAHGGRHLATSRPETASLRGVLRDEDVDRAVLSARFADTQSSLFAGARVAVDLDEQ